MYKVTKAMDLHDVSKQTLSTNKNSTNKSSLVLGHDADHNLKLVQ